MGQTNNRKLLAVFFVIAGFALIGIKKECLLTPFNMKMVMIGQCPSSLKDVVCTQMKNPKSFKCIKIKGTLSYIDPDRTDADSKKIPFMYGTMTYMGTNSFGAFMTNEISFTIDDMGTCNIN